MIKEFQDSLTDLKTILKEIEKTEITRETEIEEVKKELKKLEIEKSS